MKERMWLIPVRMLGANHIHNCHSDSLLVLDPAIAACLLEMCKFLVLLMLPLCLSVSIPKNPPPWVKLWDPLSPSEDKLKKVTKNGERTQEYM